MDYRNRKIHFEKKNLAALLRMLAEGKFLIPTFQRNFIWNPEHITGLWESIYLGYPVGSLVYWRTPLRLKVHRRLGGFQIPQDSKTARGLRSYILDGQQRATSLFVAFYGGKGQVKGKRNFDYSLYFDLTKRKFFFQHELYRHRWDAPDEFLIRLKDIPDLPADHEKQLAKVKGYRKIAANFQQLRHIFTGYELPLIRLEGFDIADVCDVFERMNQTGVKLENMDIIIARNFHDNPTIIEEDFPE